LRAIAHACVGMAPGHSTRNSPRLSWRDDLEGDVAFTPRPGLPANNMRAGEPHPGTNGVVYPKPQLIGTYDLSRRTE
jgi:hypothetical protein